jgi:hypothetical protein
LRVAVLQADSVSHGAGLLVLVGRGDERLQPAIEDNGVVVEQDEQIATGRCAPSIAGPAESPVDR